MLVFYVSHYVLVILFSWYNMRVCICQSHKFFIKREKKIWQRRNPREKIWYDVWLVYSYIFPRYCTGDVTCFLRFDTLFSSEIVWTTHTRSLENRKNVFLMKKRKKCKVESEDMFIDKFLGLSSCLFLTIFFHFNL